MKFEFFRFANLVANLHFVTESDYDSCIGEVKVTDGSNVYAYCQSFSGSAERNNVMAEAMRVCANKLEVKIMKEFNFVCGNVQVCFEERSLEAALNELQRRLELAKSCGVNLSNWLDFKVKNF